MKISSKKLIINMHNLQAGSEEGARQYLLNEGHSNFYKALGTYDLISFSEVDSLAEAGSCQNYVSEAYASSVVSLYAFEKTNSKKPSFLVEAARLPLLGLIRLEVNYDSLPQHLIHSGVCAIYELVEPKINEIAQRDGLCAMVYAGFGDTDVYIFVISETLQEIASFTQSCRRLFYSNTECGLRSCDREESVARLFSRTQTIPAISYRYINSSDGKFTVTGVEGQTRAIVSIRCIPGFEDKVSSYFCEEKGYVATGLLGDADVIIETSGEIPTSRLIEDVLNFRADINRAGVSGCDTTTSIVSAPLERFKISQQLTPIESKTPHPLHHRKLIEPDGVINDKLLRRLKVLYYRLKEYQKNRSTAQLVFQPSLHYNYLIANLLALDRNIKPDARERQELKLISAIETVEQALSQRLDSRFSGFYISYSMPIPFGDGIKIPVLAIESLIRFIFETWEKSFGPMDIDATWNGFPVFSDSHSFQLRFLDSIYFPLEAIYNGGSYSAHWLTVTHEISHAIFYKTNFLANEKEILDSAYLAIKGQRNKDIESWHIPDKVYFNNFVNELFAHWFDFSHFYESKPEDFFPRIWKSWERLSIVSEHFTEYFVRSYAIYCTIYYDEWAMFLADRNSIELGKIFVKKWIDHEAHIAKIGIRIPQETKTKLNELRDYKIRVIMCLCNVMNRIVNKYNNIDFRNTINQSYSNLSRDVDSIFSGAPIQQTTPNPFLLLKEVERKSDKNGDQWFLPYMLSVSRAY